jgi:hypothetical protein
MRWDNHPEIHYGAPFTFSAITCPLHRGKKEEKELNKTVFRREQAPL